MWILTSVQVENWGNKKFTNLKLQEGLLRFLIFCFYLQVPNSLLFVSSLSFQQAWWFPFSPVSQDIIPQPLLDEYVSMTDPARAQTVDSDIAKHCAYSLPGVALTLGRQNWHCLKDTYATLASDVKVRVAREHKWVIWRGRGGKLQLGSRPEFTRSWLPRLQISEERKL